MGDVCKYPNTEHLCEILSKFGIGDDLDWVALVLFARNLVGKGSLLNEEQKTRVQKLIFNAVSKGDFSRQAFGDLVGELENYLASISEHVRLTRELERERSLSDVLLEEIRGILTGLAQSSERSTDKVKSFGEHTIRAVEGNEDRQKVADSIRSMLADVISDLKHEADHWENRARNLEEQTHYDPLLGDVYNRRALDQYLEQAVQHHQSKNTPLTLVLFDLDHFKKVNDIHGHLAGDSVLKALAGILKAGTLQHDGFVARFGGEELVAVFEDTDKEQAREIAETILNEVRQFEHIQPDRAGKPVVLKFTISAGIAQLHPGWGVNELINAADRAMYEAKDAGRDTVCCFSGM